MRLGTASELGQSQLRENFGAVCSLGGCSVDRPTSRGRRLAAPAAAADHRDPIRPQRPLSAKRDSRVTETAAAAAGCCCWLLLLLLLVGVRGSILMVPSPRAGHNGRIQFSTHPGSSIAGGIW